MAFPSPSPCHWSGPSRAASPTKEEVGAQAMSLLCTRATQWGSCKCLREVQAQRSQTTVEEMRPRGQGLPWGPSEDWRESLTETPCCFQPTHLPQHKSPITDNLGGSRLSALVGDTVHGIAQTLFGANPNPTLFLEKSKSRPSATFTHSSCHRFSGVLLTRLSVPV